MSRFRIKKINVKYGFIVIGVCISFLALEDHLYQYYFLLSALGFFILSIFTFNRFLPKIKERYWFLIMGFSISCLFFSILNGNLIYFLKAVLIMPVLYILYVFGKYKSDILFFVFMFFAALFSLFSLLLQIFDGIFLLWEFKFQRNASIFFDPNYAAVIFSSSIILTISLVNKFFLKILLLSLYTLSLLFTYSKSGMLSLLLGLVFYFYNRYSYRFLLYMFPWIILISVILLSIDLSMFRFGQGLNNRDLYFQLTIEHVFSAGNLWGGDPNIIKELIMGLGYDNSSTHNYYLDLLLLNGVFPFLFLIPLLSLIIFRGVKYRNKYFPLFLSLFFLSNTISISMGGVGVLSILLTFSSLLILNERR